MSAPGNTPHRPPEQPMMAVPTHWSPEQALAVFEYLGTLRQALWSAYGPMVQQAWRDQLVHDHPPPQIDPDEPF